MASTLLQVDFRFNVFGEDYENDVSPPAEDFAAVKGLKWKIRLMNETRSEAGGLMLNDGESSLWAFPKSPLAAKVTGHQALSDISVKSFGVMNKPSTITRGPLELAAKTSS